MVIVISLYGFYFWETLLTFQSIFFFKLYICQRLSKYIRVRWKQNNFPSLFKCSKKISDNAICAKCPTLPSTLGPLYFLQGLSKHKDHILSIVAANNKLILFPHIGSVIQNWSKMEGSRLRSRFSYFMRKINMSIFLQRQQVLL